MFDVTMGAYDRAEVCKMVWTFLSYKLSQNIIKEHWSLSRWWFGYFQKLLKEN